MLQHIFLSLLMYMFMLAVVWLSQWYRFHHGPAHGKGGGRSLLPRRLKPRTPLDCPACCLSASHSSPGTREPAPVPPWREVKSRRGARHPGGDRGLCLSQSSLCVLRDQRCGCPCHRERWELRQSRADPAVALSGVWKQVQCAPPHATVSAQNAVASRGSGAGCLSGRIGCLCSGARLWHSTCNNHTLADAGGSPCPDVA